MSNAVDFQKAFNVICLDAIWNALRSCEIEESYVHLRSYTQISEVLSKEMHGADNLRLNAGHVKVILYHLCCSTRYLNK